MIAPSNELPTFLSLQSAVLSLEFLCHDSVESFDQAAGRTGACLEAAHRYHVHRFHLEKFYRELIPKFEKLSGIARRLDESKLARKRASSPNPEKISPIYEKPTTYLIWLWPQLTDDLRESLGALARAESQKSLIDVSPSDRNSTIDPSFYKRADSILDQEIEVIKTKLPRWQNLVPDYSLAWEDSGKPNRESLARLLQKYQEAVWANED